MNIRQITANFLKHLCTGLLLVAFPLVALSDSQVFTDSLYNFELQIPEGMTQILNPNPEVRLALRSADGFPTFNVIARAGSRRVIPGNNFCEQMLSDYRNVGLTDVSLIKTVPARSPGGSNPLCVISYSQAKQKMFSQVTTVDLADMHFLLTYIGKTPKLEHEVLFRSFKVIRSEAIEAGGKESNYTPLLYIFLTLCVILALVFIIRKIKSSL